MSIYINKKTKWWETWTHREKNKVNIAILGKTFNKYFFKQIQLLKELIKIYTKYGLFSNEKSITKIHLPRIQMDLRLTVKIVMVACCALLCLALPCFALLCLALPACMHACTCARGDLTCFALLCSLLPSPSFPPIWPTVLIPLPPSPFYPALFFPLCFPSLPNAQPLSVPLPLSVSLSLSRFLLFFKFKPAIEYHEALRCPLVERTARQEKGSQAKLLQPLPHANAIAFMIMLL